MNALLALLLGYALGSVPFGLLLTRLSGAGDLRQVGSGNIGATNVLRTGRKGLAAATLLLDLAKGVAAVLLAGELLPGAEAFAAIGAVVGHCFPLWLGFRGGKGVATLLGVATALCWQVGVAFASIWLAVLALFRFSSLSGMTAAVGAPLAMLALGYRDYALALAALAVLVLFQHRANIARLRAGTEPRVGQPEGA